MHFSLFLCAKFSPRTVGCPFCIAGECNGWTAPPERYDSPTTIGLSFQHGGGECNGLTAPP